MEYDIVSVEKAQKKDQLENCWIHTPWALHKLREQLTRMRGTEEYNAEHSKRAEDRRVARVLVQRYGDLLGMETCEICGKQYQEDPWDPEGKLEAFLKEKYPELEDPVEWAITQVLPEIPYCVECAIGFFEGRT